MKWILIICTICLSLTTQAQNTTLPISDTTSVLVFAHRGFRSLSPENTIAAMKTALQYTRGLEMDFMFTKDMKMVVTHDPKLNKKLFLDKNGQPLKGKNYIIYKMNYDSLRQYKLGLLPHPLFPTQQKEECHIPLLTELVDSMELFAKQQHLPLPIYLIETKLKPEGDNILHPGPEVFVDSLLHLIQARKLQDRVIVQSFDPRTLSLLKKKAPQIKVLLLAAKDQSLNDYLFEIDFKPEYFSPKVYTPEIITQAQEKHIQLIGGNFQTNDIHNIDTLKNNKITMCISDFPIQLMH